LPSSLRLWLTPVLLGFACLLLYSINLGRPAHYDEFFHLLAAEGLLATGEPAIGEDGRYWRGYPLTWLVAQSFALFGQSLAAARLPPILFMAALVVLLFLFLRRHGDAATAWIGAGLFAISPFAIELAQFVRFYSLQCLAFFAAAWIAYELLARPFRPWRYTPWAALALALIAFATYLQPTTLLGSVGLGLWIGGALLLPWLLDPARPRPQKLALLLALATAGLVGLGLAWASGLLASLWQDYRTAPLFNQHNADRFWFYHAWYSLFYPTLWTLAGVLALLALIKAPRLASFLLVVFATGFLLNSFAASKSLRYIAYAQPFLFGLWGLGLAWLLARARGRIGWLREQLTPCLALFPRPVSHRLAQLLVVGAIAFLVLANPAWLRSVSLFAGITVPPELPPARWDAARPALEPWLERVEVVVTTDDLGMLYHYDRADYLLSASKFGELPRARREPFGRDARSDVPVIKDVESLELIMACHSSGLFVTNASRWLGGARARSEVVNTGLLLDTHAQEIDVPEESRLVAYVWQQRLDIAETKECSLLPERRG